MESKEEMLKKLGLKTMFNISDEEMPELVEEYDIFMNHLTEASQKGMETLKIAIAISLGIMCVLLIPQKLFVRARAIFTRKPSNISEQKNAGGHENTSEQKNAGGHENISSQK